MTSPASSIQLGSYQLLERIGEGGTAHVYRATDAGGKPVAVKLLAPQAELDDASARARFEREIRALGEIEHPNVLPLLDSGIDDELGPYLVTPLVTGKSLRELLAGVRLPPEGGLLLARAAAGAAAALHERGLVHRDLKPENLMVHPDGRVVLFDLGLAYRAGQTRYTDEGAVVGSVPYMAPEQVEGRGVSEATDVWALGVMAYEWTCGRRPFERDRPAEEAAAILVGSYTPASAVDRRVDARYDRLVDDCLAARPAARPTAADIAARATAGIDWVDAADEEAVAAELAALVGDPAGFADRVAGFRVRRLERQAREALEGGSAFAALKVIDRGLAYAPDDPALTELAQSAEAAGDPSPPSPEAPRSSRKLALAIAAALIGVVTLALVVALVRGGDTGDEAESTSTSASGWQTQTSQTEPGTDQTLELVGDFIDVFKKGIEASENHDRRKAIAEANREPEPPAGDALSDVEPIPLGELSNDDPRADVDLVADSGETLVPPSVLGGVAPADAIADFDRRHTGDPGDVDVAVARALVYLAAGKTAPGIEQLESLVEKHPASAAVWAAHGFAQLRRGRFADAETALGRAIELDPKDAQSLRNRGILRSRLGRTRDAYLDLRRAVELSPGDTDARRELARIYRRTGRTAAARLLLE